MLYLLLCLACCIDVTEERKATSPDSIRVAEGFEVELLRSAQEGESSWISMTFDSEGDLIVGLDDKGVARLGLSAGSENISFERLAGTETMRHIRGILYAHGSLYVCATDSQEIYRLMDQDGDGIYEKKELFQRLPYNSRFGHGANQIVLGPDNLLYFVIGNDVVMPAEVSAQSNYHDPQNDWLLPYKNDIGQDNRVGYIAQVDPDGKSWKVLAGGFRNQVDMAFNKDGEMFTWDADMEWDVGLPWYRPTRLNHIIRGGEYGWRWGTGKWPAWFPDSLPSTLDTGYSSPTGLVCCHRSQWPSKYQNKLLMADWQLGRIFAVTLTPSGATYQAEAELFAEGGPLNVCDMVFGPDGQLYFITGGRGSQSGLYRIKAKNKGSENVEVNEEKLRAVAEKKAELARSLRKRLEVLQEQPDISQLDFIWECLGSDDEWLAFSARVALERQPKEAWLKRLADTSASLASQRALIALARIGTRSDQPMIIKSMLTCDWNKMAPSEMVVPLRALQLTIIRHGDLDGEWKDKIQKNLDPLFPSQDFPVNWLLQELLVKWEAENVIERSLTALETAATQEEQFQYAKTLIQTNASWREEDLRRMLVWLQQSRRYQGGKLLDTIRKQFIEAFISKVNIEQREKLLSLIEALDKPLEGESDTVVSNRPFVKKWTLQDLENDIAGLDLLSRSTENGKVALAAASCLKCHRVGQRGTQVGPDLTGVGKRYDNRALLESILQPSAQIDPKYLNTSYLLKDGTVVSGRTVGVSSAQLVIETDSISGKTETIQREDIDESSPSKISPMPEGLVDVLTKDELLDLIAYLRRDHGE